MPVFPQPRETPRNVLFRKSVKGANNCTFATTGIEDDFLVCDIMRTNI